MFKSTLNYNNTKLYVVKPKFILWTVPATDVWSRTKRIAVVNFKFVGLKMRTLLDFISEFPYLVKMLTRLTNYRYRKFKINFWIQHKISLLGMKTVWQETQ